MPPDGFFGINFFVKIQFRTPLRELTTPDPLVGWGGGRRIPTPHFSPTRRLWRPGSVVGAQGAERAMMVNAYLDPPAAKSWRRAWVDTIYQMAMFPMTFGDP